MKQTLFLFLSLSIFTLSFSQEKTKFGSVPLTTIKSSSQKVNDKSILFSELKPVSGTAFKLLKTETDKLGMKHRTYQQYYNGLKIQFGVIKIHEKNGLRTSYNGAYFNPLNVRVSANISKQQIESIAKRFMKSNDVFWLDDNGVSKSNSPNPELLILPNRRTSTLELAYAIGVGVSSPTLKMGILYVDAKTGVILKFKNHIFTCFENKENDHDESYSKDKNNSTPFFVSGTGATVYSGSQSIETTLDSSDYILYDQSRANTGSSHNAGVATKNGIATVNFNHDTSLSNYNNSGTITDFTDANNNWTAANMSSDEDQYALDAHWGAQVVYDYFDTEHGRDSYDGNDSAIVSYVHFGTDYTNASWVSFTNKRGFMIYGDGGGSFTPLTSLDVAAHEIGHGITNNTAELDYELESGALNEGFSDIWAMVIENHANNNLGTSKDIALINDENGGGALRSMSNPNAYSLPDTYGGTYWYDVTGCTPDVNTNDYCGVHTNSGVLSYWFWLLSQGGSGTNDIGDAFSVTALGMNDAAAIAYRMQNTYLTATSDYADARAAGIQAAIDLFGDFCTSQEEAVTNAFYAVGVGSEWSANGQSPTLTTDITDQTVCLGIDQVQITAAATDWTNKRWQVYNAGSWDNIDNGGYYANVYANTMRINNPDVSLNGAKYRVYYENNCGKTHSSVMTLTVNEYPVATVDSSTNETCVGNDGSLTVSFTDNTDMTNIDFSIDGGATYPYSYLVNSGTQTISNLTAETYNVWVRWDDDSCAVDLGDHTLNGESSPSVTVDTITDETCTLNDGSIAVSFTDNAVQTEIDFSINGGVSYDYTFNDADGSGTITGLVGGEYQVWASYAGTCPVDLGTQTLSSDAPVTTVIAIDSSIGGDDGGFSVTFENNASRGLLKFSIDGGTNYDYPFNDNLGSGSITGLAAATYNVWVVWGNDECPKELGDYTINESSDYVSIPDSNFENALYDLGYDDLLGDNKVPIALINTVQWLNVAYENITDVTGIEAFTALTNFDCSNNSLTSVDVTSNLLLDTFRCDNNLLTNVNVSTNSALLYLECFDNSLETIDVSNNLLLQKLQANNNSLTSLNVSGNPALETLECSNNNLTYLNFKNGNNANTWNNEFEATGNTNLTCIEVDDAVYSTGAWDNIDTGVIFSTYCSYTTITDANFEAALDALGFDDISNDGQVPTSLINTLTSLDVGGQSISDLTGIEDFIALETLDVDTNTLGTINLSTLLNLKNLYGQRNSLTSLDVSANTNLEVLSLIDNELSALDLTNNINLTNLGFKNNSITTIDLSNNPLLDHLVVANNGMTSLDVTNNPVLRNFYAQDNNISPSLDLTNNPNLEIIAVTNSTALTYVDVRNGNNTNVNTFNFSGCTNLVCISVDDVANAEASSWNVHANTNYTETDYCDYTAIPDTNFEAELEALGYDDVSGDGQVPTALIESVTTLDLFSKGISSLDGIEDFTALTWLDAGGNSLTTLDVSNNTLLETLALFNNGLTVLDFSTNTALKSLTLDFNSLTSINVTTCTSLETLYCSENNSLATLDVTNNTALKTLNLNKCNLSSLDLSNNVVLEYLNVNQNAITILDVSNNVVLADLYAELNGLGTLNLGVIASLVNVSLENNILTALDVSSNVLLEALNCIDNTITSLDLSQNNALIEIEVSTNNLSFLDVRNGNNAAVTKFDAEYNSALTCIQIDDLNNDYSSWIKEASTSFTETDYCEYTAIPDANFEAWLDNQGYDDISGDGQVPTALIEVVTSISPQFEDILDFTGIEDFTALESLSVSYNSFTALDVSNNTNLTFLNCGYSFLTNLDVSNNILLETLWVNSTNLSALDLSQNTNLTSLTASAVSGLTTLNMQNGNNTNVTHFTTTGNGNLSCVLVDDLINDYSSWDKEATTSFSDTYCRYTAIPDANFEAALDALGYDDISSDGQVPTALIEVVTNLDVSSESISNLTGIEDFTALLDLNIQDNSLSNVDLSGNILLEDLNCAHNNFFYLDLSANTVLNSLYANNNYLIELDLSLNTQLQYLYVVDNQLSYLNYQNGNNTNNLFFNTTGNSNLFCILVDDAIYSTTNWASIDAQTSFSNTYCRYTAIPDVNFEAALESLGYDDISSDGQVPTVLIEAVTLLDISSQNISDLTGIEDFIALDTLDCSSNNLSEVDFGSNVPLTYLDISSNNLEVLVTPTSIVSLTANSNNIVFLDLKAHIALEELSVYSNELIYLNLQNGANTNMSSVGLYTTNNPDLTCVIVDDVTYSTSNWTSIDPTTSFSTTYCKYTQIPDANFEARLDNLGYDDISSDGQVPTALIIDVQFLDVSFSSSGAIYDLTGIEDFYSLDNIFLTDNLMTSIDLSSNNYLLQVNANNTALTSIDLSSNPALNFVTLSDSDDLSSVNLQNGTNTNFVGSSSFTAVNVPNLSCVLVDDVSYANATWVNHIDPQITFNEVSCSSVTIAPKVFLQGALLNPNTGEESWMRDDLRLAGALYGGTSPYGDGVQIDEGIGADDAGANSTVDWIWVELRDATDPTVIIAGQSAILQRDGDVVDVASDRITPLTFDINEGSYYVVIKHRNHLGVMTANTVALSETVTNIDFTDASNEITYGTNAQTSYGMPSGIVAMWAGDTNGDTEIKQQGSSNDSNAIKDIVIGEVGNTSSNNLYTFDGYSTADVNLDGTIKFQGSGNDSSMVKDNIISDTLNTDTSNLYIIQEQIPQ